MSTRVGVICEGPIDAALLSALLHRIAQDKAGYAWPVAASDLDETLRLRTSGHGAVVKKLAKLVRVLDRGETLDCRFFVIVLDYKKTKTVQQDLRALVAGSRRSFILGIAIEEIEAWWLADRSNTLAWFGLADEDIAGCAYATPDYSPERDSTPKRTLTELTKVSERCSRPYGTGNSELAREFAEDWREHASIQVMEHACARGFGPFSNAVADAFQRCLREDASSEGRLFP